MCVCTHEFYTHGQGLIPSVGVLAGPVTIYIYYMISKNVSIYTAMYMSECLCCDGDHTKPTNFQNVKLVLKLTECVALLALRLLGVCQFCGKFVTKYTF